MGFNFYNRQKLISPTGSLRELQLRIHFCLTCASDMNTFGSNFVISPQSAYMITKERVFIQESQGNRTILTLASNSNFPEIFYV